MAHRISNTEVKSRNDKIFASLTKRLESEDEVTFVDAANKLMSFVSKPQAYYAEARPLILAMCKIARATLARLVKSDAPFRCNPYYPPDLIARIAAYANLVHTISRHARYFEKDRIPKEELNDLLSSVEISMPEPIGMGIEIPDIEMGNISPMYTSILHVKTSARLNKIVRSPFNSVRGSTTPKPTDSIRADKSSLEHRKEDENPPASGVTTYSDVDKGDNQQLQNTVEGKQPRTKPLPIPITSSAPTIDIPLHASSSSTLPTPTFPGPRSNYSDEKVNIDSITPNSPSATPQKDTADNSSNDDTSIPKDLSSPLEELTRRHTEPPSITLGPSTEFQPASLTPSEIKQINEPNGLLHGRAVGNILNNISHPASVTFGCIEPGKQAGEIVILRCRLTSVQKHLLSLWQARDRLEGDLATSLCLSLACYRYPNSFQANFRPANEANPLNSSILLGLPVSWPTNARLSADIGTSRIFLAPPLQPSAENLVDISPFVNTNPVEVRLDHAADMKEYIFALISHPPTPSQLWELEEQRTQTRSFHAVIDGLRITAADVFG